MALHVVPAPEAAARTRVVGDHGKAAAHERRNHSQGDAVASWAEFETGCGALAAAAHTAIARSGTLSARAVPRPRERRRGKMNPAARLNVSEAALATLCSKYSVQELALFGSAARLEASPDSDIDLLVCFEDGVPVTLFTLIELQAELSALLARRVDLVPKNGLKPALRAEVLSKARVLYAA